MQKVQAVSTRVHAKLKVCKFPSIEIFAISRKLTSILDINRHFDVNCALKWVILIQREVGFLVYDLGVSVRVRM